MSKEGVIEKAYREAQSFGGTWEESDAYKAQQAIDLNLEKLERLVPGAKIQFSNGDAWKLNVYGTAGQTVWHRNGAVYLVHRPELVAVFKDAIRGGAVVVLPGEEM